ncbi:MAG: hypothetical protein WC327_00305 [Candidatus Cloacimonadia bacterium]|jgi:cell division protein FtsL
MKSKIFILILVVAFSGLGRYVLKNDIHKKSRENVYLEKELESEKTINKDLTSECLELQSSPRIINIATNQLNMKYDDSRIIRVSDTGSKNKRQFTLIDYFVPKAEALTPK